MLPSSQAVINAKRSRSILERYGTEGNTPVDVSLALLSVTPSNTEPLKFRVNLAGPPAKPKYSLVTDSGQVP
jgi:hypothetical protein